MTESDSGRRWLSAALLLADNPAADVACPECGRGPLAVADIESGQGDGLMERILQCPQCGARNAIRMGARRTG